MNRSLLLALPALLLLTLSALAQPLSPSGQSPSGQPASRQPANRQPEVAPLPRQVHDPAVHAAAVKVVGEFLQQAIDHRQTADSLLRFSTGGYSEALLKMGRDTVWPIAPESYRIGDVYAIREGDTAMMVTVVTENGTVPRVGPLEVDCVFFLQPGPLGDLRISAFRRMTGVDRNLREIRYVDTSTVYPERLKPEIIREESTILMSNRQLREHFLTNRVGFTRLLEQFGRNDSLTMLGRVDRKVAQLNRFSIEWGPAAHDVPKDVMDEYLKTLPKKQRQELEKQVRLAESVRRSGYDTLAHMARVSRLPMARIDSAIALMYDLRVTFVNALLPWPDAVQFTLAGRFGDAVGLIYSPHGELPLISPIEYYYLEEIGGGWWIFRST